MLQATLLSRYSLHAFSRPDVQMKFHRDVMTSRYAYRSMMVPYRVWRERERAVFCEASDVGLLSDVRPKKGPMIVPFSISLRFIVDLDVEKRGCCGSVNVRINHGDDLQLLCIGAVMVRQAL